MDEHDGAVFLVICKILNYKKIKKCSPKMCTAIYYYKIFN